jgi:hypothetical protein
MEQSKFATTVAARAQHSMKIAQVDWAFHPISMSNAAALLVSVVAGPTESVSSPDLAQAETPSFSGATSLPVASSRGRRAGARGQHL